MHAAAALVSALLLFLTTPLFSQRDSAKTAGTDSLTALQSKSLNARPETERYDSAFVWSDRRTLSEVIDDTPGSFSYTFSNGGRSSLIFNGITEKEIAILRDGVQVNDIYYGGADAETFSVNDIEALEKISAVSSFVYGITANSKSFNIITKDRLSKKPFSQLRYSQDRFNSLYADVFFSLPVTKWHFITLGLTKHSIDGRYTNSAFDVWNGRARLTSIFTKILSVRADFYYSRIERGLNEGLLNTQTEEVLRDDDAVVNNPFSSENIEQFNYGITFMGRFFGTSSLTKLQVYSNNILRDYTNTIEDSSLVHSGFSESEKVHYVNNSALLSQEGRIGIAKGLDLRLFGSLTGYVNNYDRPVNFQTEGVRISGRADIEYRKMRLTFLGSSMIAGDGYGIPGLGAEVSLPAYSGKDHYFELFGGINETGSEVIAYDPYKIRKFYYEAGMKYRFRDLISLEQLFYMVSPQEYEGNSPTGYADQKYSGAVTSLHFRIWDVFTDAEYSYSGSDILPDHDIGFDISYRNRLFRNKLDLRAGFRGNVLIRKGTEFLYDQRNYSFGNAANTYSKEQFSIDAYIGARIGRANINLTLANVFDAFAYGANMYPLDNRGGFLNSISRFTIVWDFID